MPENVSFSPSRRWVIRLSSCLLLAAILTWIPGCPSGPSNVVKGKVKSTVGAEEFIMGPGDVGRHPAGVLHGLEAIEESVVVEIKSPAPDIGAFFAMRKED